MLRAEPPAAGPRRRGGNEGARRPPRGSEERLLAVRALSRQLRDGLQGRTLRGAASRHLRKARAWRDTRRAEPAGQRASGRESAGRGSGPGDWRAGGGGTGRARRDSARRAHDAEMGVSECPRSPCPVSRFPGQTRGFRVLARHVPRLCRCSTRCGSRASSSAERCHLPARRPPRCPTPSCCPPFKHKQGDAHGERRQQRHGTEVWCRPPPRRQWRARRTVRPAGDTPGGPAASGGESGDGAPAQGCPGSLRVSAAARHAPSPRRCPGTVTAGNGFHVLVKHGGISGPPRTRHCNLPSRSRPSRLRHEAPRLPPAATVPAGHPERAHAIAGSPTPRHLSKRRTDRRPVLPHQPAVVAEE